MTAGKSDQGYLSGKPVLGGLQPSANFLDLVGAFEAKRSGGVPSGGIPLAGSKASRPVSSKLDKSSIGAGARVSVSFSPEESFATPQTEPSSAAPSAPPSQNLEDVSPPQREAVIEPLLSESLLIQASKGDAGGGRSGWPYADENAAAKADVKADDGNGSVPFAKTAIAQAVQEIIREKSAESDVYSPSVNGFFKRRFLLGSMAVVAPLVLFAAFGANRTENPTSPDPIEVVTKGDGRSAEPPVQELVTIVDRDTGAVIAVLEEDKVRPFLEERARAAEIEAARQAEAARLAVYAQPVVAACAAVDGFDDLWVGGLDKGEAFKAFAADYAERTGLDSPVGTRSGYNRIAQMQRALAINNCYDGTPSDSSSGRFDASTIEAIKRFQTANGLIDSGEVDQRTVDLLATAAAKRVTLVMVNLDKAAKHFGLDTQDVFQVAWHESFYNNMVDSGTGPEGVGQMTDATFLGEMRRMNHAFYDEYQAGHRKGGDERRAVRAQLEDLKHSPDIGAIAMVSHCKALVEEWNKAGCAQAYPIYQLGAGDYMALRRAAARNPKALARKVAGGTRYNNYGSMTAANAFAHVSGMVNSSSDKAIAAKDVAYLSALMAERQVIIDTMPYITPAARGFMYGLARR